MKTIILFLYIGLCFSCNRTKEPVPLSNSGVYVAGYGFNASRILIAKYWKDGEAIELTDGTANAASTGIAIGDNNTYVSGWDLTHSAFSNSGKYWKNDSEQDIGSSCFGTNGVATSGDDLYILGLDAAGWNYWKNGSAVSLTDSTSFQATDIAVIGEDVYVSGYTQPAYITKSHQALYWKNGQLIFQSPVQSIARGVAASGIDVYMAGYVFGIDSLHNTAVFWKNGVLQNLSDGTTDAKGYAVTVVGNDVYVAGTENLIAKYWKNGVATNLTDGATGAEAFAIAVKGDDVYVAGYEGNSARYWKNGVAQNLSDSGVDGVAVDIVVK